MCFLNVFGYFCGSMQEREENKDSFIIYRLPGSSPLCYAGISNCDDIKRCRSGFVFTQFKKTKLDSFTCNHEMELQSVEELTDIIKNLSVKSTSGKSTEFNDYKCGFDKIKEMILSSPLKKCVLSKRIFTTEIDAQNAILLFKNYLERFPNAFVSFVYLKNESIWCGASPELFLNKNGSLAHTVALASTRKVEERNTKPQWNAKEVKEQWYVEKFVEDNLNDLGLKFSKTKAESAQSGMLWHLKTSYSFSSDFNLDHFVEKMHPTPAVGGSPKYPAVSLISEIENHDRKYYAGIIGPFNTTKSANLFVNIRCLEIFSNGSYIYSGGGITNKSELNSEWEETNIKARSLMLI